MTGSVITFSVGSDSGSVAPAFALAKSAAISSALSWRFGSLSVVSATASSATGLGSTTGSGSITATGSGSAIAASSTTGSGIASMAGADCGASVVCLGISTFAVN